MCFDQVACNCYEDSNAVLELNPRSSYLCSLPHLCRHALAPERIGPAEVRGVRHPEDARHQRTIICTILTFAIATCVWWTSRRGAFSLFWELITCHALKPETPGSSTVTTPSVSRSDLTSFIEQQNTKAAIVHVRPPTTRLQQYAD